MTEERENNSIAVAVVGASFAGLSFARTIQEVSTHRHGSNGTRFQKIEVTAFESNNNYSIDKPIDGPICMRDAETVFEKLNLAKVWATLLKGSKEESDQSDKNHSILQSEIINALADSLQPGTIQYNLRLHGVRKYTAETMKQGNKNQDKRAVECVFKCIGKGSDTFVRRYFDYVVGADGITSTLRSLIISQGLPNLWCRCALIGDARVQVGRELFFGVFRRRNGATKSLNDGFEAASVFTDFNFATDLNNSGHPNFGTFSVDTWQRTRTRQSFIYIFMFVALISWNMSIDKI
mmetsp:Transcript_12556/g.16300  ORF Transcript_12556/g.16300 Transcript_12556/m.16300 type:complete len:293 (+) Transcript_12556:48-926(+)